MAAPLGIVAINNACKELYPQQNNPRQVTSLIKYWMNGPDPLDYITIYRNSDIDPAHWHYVTYGLSDLYGDKRIHRDTHTQLSGFGFELTFRLLSHTETPPSWPAELLQSIARYVFSSGSFLCPGDHISWHSALDGGQSPLQHILLCQDPQLSTVYNTPHGTLSFIQCVGVCSAELQAAQWWNCIDLLSLMKHHKLTGGSLLVTDMNREQSLFDIDHSTKVRVDEGVCTSGSLLSGVNALVEWTGAPSAYQQPHTLHKVKVQLSREALMLLPMAIRGRLKHGRHFTFKSYISEWAVTCVVCGVEGALATEEDPLVANGAWLQVFLSHSLLNNLEHRVTTLLESEAESILLPEIQLELAILNSN